MGAPTLLVGLGGAGSEIVQKVYNRATPDQRKSMSFVILDTDINELYRIEEKTPQIRTIQTSSSLSVGEYLDCDHFARDNWFPVNRILTSKSLTEGAGQVRATSRLALNTAIQQGRMAPLDESIESLYKLSGKKQVQAPRVILTGSLCGGTGSGLILPVSMYIRNFLTTRMQQSTAIIRGFFLLPEVFDGVIATQSERNRLRANAYAAVREIDAFLMKGDGNLSDKYDLHFMAPRAGYAEPEEYTGRPMDYCFLFDAQNIAGQKLNSTIEYKEHAANCIYGLAIAPTSTRSSSSEDNVISELVSASGRNRFAGAGTSMLVFPFEDVRHYLALSWTKENISNEWLRVDKQFKDKKRANSRRLREGYRTADIDRGEDYIIAINEGCDAHEAFASQVRLQCIEIDSNGFTEKGYNWVLYSDVLQSHIKKAVDAQKERIKGLIDDLDFATENARDDEAAEADFAKLYSNLLGYKNATVQSTETISRNIEYDLFKDDADYTRTKDQFRIEYWLHRNLVESDFLHPNAVRYFLYNAIVELTTRRAEALEEVRKTESLWRTFEEEQFDDPDTEGVKETAEDWYRRYHLDEQNKFKRFLHRREIANAQGTLNDAFDEFRSRTDAYWEAYVSAEVYKSAIEYMRSLGDAFHYFYDELDRSLGKIDREMAQIEGKYEFVPGRALRYVCADEECLKSFAKECVNLSGAIELPSELCRNIFQKMKTFALLEQKPEAAEYFAGTFRGVIIKYYEDEVINTYGPIVDLDCISAIEREARYKSGGVALEHEDEMLYTKHLLESAELLAKPFIESPMGKEPRIITACTYSTSIVDSDIAGREEFVKKNLADHGGVADEDFDKTIIMFYKSVYGLRANELSKFTPARRTETFDQPAGEYYKAYHELIGQLHPQPQKSRAITPHIDRWWHLINKMPDLDETSQRMQEDRINAAFFWGILASYVDYELKDSRGFVYKPNTSKLNLDIDTDDDDCWLMVSNGTVCDHLYEALDAFAIYPKLVNMVLADHEREIKRNVESKTPLEKSELFKYLRDFTVREFDKGFRKTKTEDDPDRGPIAYGGNEVIDKLIERLKASGEDLISFPEAYRSVFDLPILMKYSVPVDDYHEQDVLHFLECIFVELRKYVEFFCSKKESAGAYIRLLSSQFVLFLYNMAAGRGMLDNIFNDSLFSKICKSVVVEFRACDRYDEAEAIEDAFNALRES
ncbi:MAG: tubulin-like doman-containing protein [Coriobacteriaceae bacterium]|nr:tubulin-like doman-containing protein [Coriobacteriaceae bacterium]